MPADGIQTRWNLTDWPRLSSRQSHGYRGVLHRDHRRAATKPRRGCRAFDIPNRLTTPARICPPACSIWKRRSRFPPGRAGRDEPGRRDALRGDRGQGRSAPNLADLKSLSLSYFEPRIRTPLLFDVEDFANLLLDRATVFAVPTKQSKQVSVRPLSGPGLFELVKRPTLPREDRKPAPPSRRPGSRWSTCFTALRGMFKRFAERRGLAVFEPPPRGVVRLFSDDKIWARFSGTSLQTRASFTVNGEVRVSAIANDDPPSTSPFRIRSESRSKIGRVGS